MAMEIAKVMELSAESPLMAFLSTTPENLVPELVAAIKWSGTLHTKSECHECGRTYFGKDLRRDRAYFESNELICKECWHFHDSGTIHNPDYKAPSWPATREREIGKRYTIDGIIRDPTGKAVGRVKDYREGCHMGQVTLTGWGDDASSYGSLDPSHTVTDREIRTIDDESGESDDESGESDDER